MTQKRKLWVDLDGVMADYEGQYRKLGGDPEEKGGRKAQRFKRPEFQNFYLHLPLLPDALTLWNFCKKLCLENKDLDGPNILSAKSNFQRTSYEDKVIWVERHLHTAGPHVVIVNMPNQKWKHCTPGDILIDDNTKNISEWVNAGGVGIIHKNAKKTIEQLIAILHTSTTHVQEAHDSDLVTLHVQEAFQNDPVTANLQETFHNIKKEGK